MRPLRTLGATCALLCALVASVIAWHWPGPARALTPERQLSAGALEGVVRWAGAGVPQPTAVENSTDPDVCGRMHTLEDVLVSDRNKGVKNVILALVDVPVGTAPPPLPGQLLLDNIDCRFSPHACLPLAANSKHTTAIRRCTPYIYTVRARPTWRSRFRA